MNKAEAEGIRSKADKEAETLAVRLGIRRLDGISEGFLTKKRAFDFLQHVVRGFYGVDARVSMFGASATRAASIGFTANNIVNVMLKIFVDVGIEEGWWADEEEFSELFKKIAAELEAAAKADADSGKRDPAEQATGDIVKAHAQEMADDFYNPEENKTAEEPIINGHESKKG